MKEMLSQLSKMLSKINTIAGHKLSTAKELKECEESMQLAQEDMRRLYAILHDAEKSLTDDVNDMTQFIVDTSEQFGNMVQEMQNIRDQITQVAVRYAKLKNITDD